MSIYTTVNSHNVLLDQTIAFCAKAVNTLTAFGEQGLRTFERFLQTNYPDHYRTVINRVTIFVQEAGLLESRTSFNIANTYIFSHLIGSSFFSSSITFVTMLSTNRYIERRLGEIHRSITQT